MPKAKQENKVQTMIVVLLGIVGLLILLIFLVIRSQADDATSEVGVDNIAPTITSFQLGYAPTTNDIFVPISGTSSLNLIEGTTTTIYANGSFQDLNGCQDVTQAIYQAEVIPPFPLGSQRISVTMGTDLKLNLYLYELGPTSTYHATEWAGDNNGRGSCVFSGCDNSADIDADFVCTFDIQFFADNTTADTPKGTGDAAYWIAKLKIRDDQLSLVQQQETFEVNLLTAVDIGDAINYGAVSIGERSATQTLVITNTGNDNTTDIDMIGLDMGCTEGTIPVTQQRYATSSAYTGTQLALTSSTVFDFDLAKQVALWATSTDDTFWTLDVPTPGGGGALAGTCTGTNTIYATAF
ncbi:MAG: hypothetical protein ABII02_01090 [Candidatus Magasanikbacteria bacterium]